MLRMRSSTHNPAIRQKDMRTVHEADRGCRWHGHVQNGVVVLGVVSTKSLFAGGVFRMFQGVKGSVRGWGVNGC